MPCLVDTRLRSALFLKERRSGSGGEEIGEEELGVVGRGEPVVGLQYMREE